MRPAAGGRFGFSHRAEKLDGLFEEADAERLVTEEEGCANTFEERAKLYFHGSKVRFQYVSIALFRRHPRAVRSLNRSVHPPLWKSKLGFVSPHGLLPAVRTTDTCSRGDPRVPGEFGLHQIGQVPVL
jgi:hypothetical protein